VYSWNEQVDLVFEGGEVYILGAFARLQSEV
jgi:hypothetical protein